MSPACHPHLLAAGASRVLNRPCVRKDCTSLRRPGPRKGDVSVIQYDFRRRSRTIAARQGRPNITERYGDSPHRQIQQKQEKGEGSQCGKQ